MTCQVPLVALNAVTGRRDRDWEWLGTGGAPAAGRAPRLPALADPPLSGGPLPDGASPPRTPFPLLPPASVPRARRVWP